jgi:hypothetical protein
MSKDIYSKAQTFSVDDKVRVFILTDLPVKNAMARISLLTENEPQIDLLLPEEDAEVLHDMLAEWLTYRRNKNG